MPSKSVLAKCIKAIRAETLEKINRLLVEIAANKRIEDGQRVRIDTTVVESNIHPPLDSNLLWDGGPPDMLPIHLNLGRRFRPFQDRN